MRAIGIGVSFDFMAVGSYGSGIKTSGEVRILKDLDESIEGKDVVLVEDILDTGLPSIICWRTCAPGIRARCGLPRC